MYKYIQQTMISFFPESILSLIHEYANTKGLWMTRFSNDVLPMINKGYHLVGMECEEHYDYGCECAKTVPCANCYTYGIDLCEHTHYESISYEEIKPRHDTFITNPYIPYEHWKYFYDKHAVYRHSNAYWMNTARGKGCTYADIVVPVLKQLNMRSCS
jgi:hypothetical protein